MCFVAVVCVLGPFCINGVPLRRVNQAYVIATSAKVDTSSVNVDDISDDFFARVESSSDKSDEFFSSEKKVRVRSMLGSGLKSSLWNCVFIFR